MSHTEESNVDATKPKSSWRKYGAVLLVACAGAVLAASSAFTATADIDGVPANGVVSFEGTGFDVMNTQLVLGSKLRFSNPGAKPLDLRIVTWRGKVVKNLTVPAHGRAVWTPKHYGVYDYFDAKTTAFGNVTIHGSGGEKVYEPVARKSSPYFPAPAYGVVAVTNADGSGIPLSSSYGSKEVPGRTTLTGKHHRAFMNQTPWIEVPGGTMTYKPWVLVVKAGQSIHVYDYDAMNHSFLPGEYPVMFLDHDHVRSYRYGFKGFVLQRHGGHRDVTFYMPGIHHILCVIHSYRWKHTYKSHHSYGGFPYVMDAVVIVEPNGKA